MNTKILKLITAIIAVLFATVLITAQEVKTMYVMKQGVIDYQSAISDVDSIIFYDPTPTPIPEDGVLINGVVWAKYNVDAPGAFATNPESFGMYYQWNRDVAWPSSGYVEDWDGTRPEGDAWEETNDPSPEGWRVPTRDDIQKLADTDKVTQTWVTENGIKCRKYTDKDAPDNFILLPAAGYRYYSLGAIFYQNQYGYYWSSETDNDLSITAYGMDFDNASTYWEFDYNRIYGFSIRCVAK